MLLCDHQAALNIPLWATGETPLHLAAAGGHVLAVRALVLDGAEMTSRNSAGQTALDAARANGHERVMALLAQSGASSEPVLSCVPS
jgi:RNA polymerase primary sigma factor